MAFSGSAPQSPWSESSLLEARQHASLKLATRTTNFPAAPGHPTINSRSLHHLRPSPCPHVRGSHLPRYLGPDFTPRSAAYETASQNRPTFTFIPHLHPIPNPVPMPSCETSSSTPRVPRCHKRDVKHQGAVPASLTGPEIESPTRVLGVSRTLGRGPDGGAYNPGPTGLDSPGPLTASRGQ